MSETPRKLATIVALDVAGYSARTEADEARTIAQIENLRPVIEGIAKTHGGRVFNTAGDGFMLEFASALSGVNAALELADECRPRVRVGVHVGEVAMQPNGDLLGHGVNVAARLMAKAEPGSALISGDVCRMIRGPLAERFVSRGPVQLDKMNETIEIFAPAGPAQPTPKPAPPKAAQPSAFQWPQWLTPRVAAMAGVPALLIALALLLWSRSGGTPPPVAETAALETSVAVLPFENLSTDKDNAFFAAGIQDEILTRLTKIGSLKVISRTSTAHLSSRPENLSEIAKQLGVANILEGSVQRQGDAVRVNVQLIKASTDSHLWAEVYDRKLDNIFAVQSEIAITVAEALSAKVTGKEKQELAAIPTKNTAAYDAYLRGRALMEKSDGLNAVPVFQQAVRLDPDFAVAWAWLVRAESWLYHRGDRTAARRDAAQQALTTALRLKPDLPEVLMAKADFRYRVERDFGGARENFEQASGRWPSNADAIATLGFIARRQGRWEEAKDSLERAATLDPLSINIRFSLAETLHLTHDFAGVIKAVDSAPGIVPDAQLLGIKAWAFLSLGQLDQARDLLAGVEPGIEDFAAIELTSRLAIYTRRYEKAVQVQEALLARAKASGAPSGAIATLELGLAELKRLSGDNVGAKGAYQHVLDETLRELRTQQNNAIMLTTLALAYSGLGDHAEAIKYADRAVTLVPVTSDAMDGAICEVARARVWARAGEKERAIPAIARLLKLSGSDLNPVILRLDPDFDKLRGDPRFDALARGDEPTK